MYDEFYQFVSPAIKQIKKKKTISATVLRWVVWEQGVPQIQPLHIK